MAIVDERRHVIALKNTYEKSPLLLAVVWSDCFSRLLCNLTTIAPCKPTVISCRPVSFGAISSKMTACFSFSCFRCRFFSVLRPLASLPSPSSSSPRRSFPGRFPVPRPRGGGINALIPPDDAATEPTGAVGTLLVTPFTWKCKIGVTIHRHGCANGRAVLLSQCVKRCVVVGVLFREGSEVKREGNRKETSLE